ncbi:MAG: hypothetical protein ABSA57_02405 [Candidatus Acidiferrales bacterium]
MAKGPPTAYSMGRALRVLGLFSIVMALAEFAPISANPIRIYGVWHCGSDLCGWDTVGEMADFDRKNHWLIDRGNGSPSVNLVVLSFVDPLRLLNLTNDAHNVEGIPVGITPDIVAYFTSHKIRVMLSIGGFTYAKDWDEALAMNPKQLGLHAAQAAQRFGVGIEIDYENDHRPNLSGLQEFITAYRSVLPYGAASANPASRLTIDLALDDDYLAPLTQYATTNWLTIAHPVLDYANAMVSSEQASASVLEEGWKEHVQGKAPIPPLAPAKFTGSLYLANRGGASAECTDFRNSLEKATGRFVKTVKPHGVGKTKGMLGYMFWAAGCPGSRSACTVPPNTCEKGVGMGAKVYKIALPMLSLRQH